MHTPLPTSHNTGPVIQIYQSNFVHGIYRLLEAETSITMRMEWELETNEASKQHAFHSVPYYSPINTIIR